MASRFTIGTPSDFVWMESREFERAYYFMARGEERKAKAALFDYLERVRLEALNSSPLHAS